MENAGFSLFEDDYLCFLTTAEARGYNNKSKKKKDKRRGTKGKEQGERKKKKEEGEGKKQKEKARRLDEGVGQKVAWIKVIIMCKFIEAKRSGAWNKI